MPSEAEREWQRRNNQRQNTAANRRRLQTSIPGLLGSSARRRERAATIHAFNLWHSEVDHMTDEEFDELTDELIEQEISKIQEELARGITGVDRERLWPWVDSSIARLEEDIAAELAQGPDCGA